MGGGVARKIAVLLVVVLVLLVGVDRIGVYIAEQAAAETIKSSQELDSRPDVDIDGFPFLTQFASGEYDRITVTADNVPVGRRSRLLVISRVRVVLRSLTVARDFSSVRAKSATATALVTYAELGKTLGIDISYAGDGRIKATKTVSVAGVSVQATLTTRPQLVNGALSFAGTSIANAGALGSGVTASLAKIFDVAIPLRNIPFQIRVQALRVGKDGVEIELTGRDLSYSS
jgi:hypothetical protein